MTSKINDKHLEFLQAVISRMAGNSFLLKGWSVTLVGALLALTVDAPGPWPAAVALLPAMTFWGLDGYFLAQERLFRRLYEAIIGGSSSIQAYSMRTDKLTPGFWLGTCFSVTLLAFHGTVVAATLLFLRLGAGAD